MKTPSKEILFLTFHLLLVQGKSLYATARNCKVDNNKILANFDS